MDLQQMVKKDPELKKLLDDAGIDPARFHRHDPTRQRLTVRFPGAASVTDFQDGEGKTTFDLDACESLKQLSDGFYFLGLRYRIIFALQTPQDPDTPIDVEFIDQLVAHAHARHQAEYTQNQFLEAAEAFAFSIVQYNSHQAAAADAVNYRPALQKPMATIEGGILLDSAVSTLDFGISNDVTENVAVECYPSVEMYGAVLSKGTYDKRPELNGKRC